MRLLKKGSVVLLAGFCLLASNVALAKETILVKVDGLYCGFCSGGLTRHLRAVHGVQTAILYLQDGKIWVKPKASSNLKLDDLKEVVDRSTYNYKGMEFRGSGTVQKEGSAYYVISSRTNNRYRLANLSQMSPSVRSSLKKASGSKSTVNIRGTFQRSGRDYLLKVDSVK